jgi:hypothetical protein
LLHSWNALPTAAEVADVAYYFRTFCRFSVPPRKRVLEWAAERSLALSVSKDDASPGRDWSYMEIVYLPARLPVLVEASGVEDNLLMDEVGEFLELVEAAPPSSARQRVVELLRSVTAVIAVTLPNDRDDETLKVASEFVDFVGQECNGFVQIDGEGFFEGGELVLEIT